MSEIDNTSVVHDSLKCYWAKCFVSELVVIESIVFATSEKFAKKMLTRKIKKEKNLDVKDFILHELEIKPQAVIPSYEFNG